LKVEEAKAKFGKQGKHMIRPSEPTADLEGLRQPRTLRRKNAALIERRYGSRTLGLSKLKESSGRVNRPKQASGVGFPVSGTGIETLSGT
jgi:hypothetical protein